MKSRRHSAPAAFLPEWDPFSGEVQMGMSFSLPPYMNVWSRRVTWFCSARSWAEGRSAAYVRLSCR